MAIEQISVFIQNSPGRFCNALEVFEKEHINLRGFSASDTGDFGIARFIVDDPSLAAKALEKEGFAFSISPILCVKLDDEPGYLRHVFSVFSNCNINIIYSYSLISTYIAFSVENIDEAEKILQETSLNVVNSVSEIS